MPHRRPLRQRSLVVFATLTLGCAPAAHSPAAAAPAPTPAASVDGAVRVRVVGTGHPVLLIPGLLSDGAVWDGTVAHLQGQAPGRYQLHVVTLAGFAGVPAVPTDSFLARATDALLAHARRARLERPVVVGHSLGAVIAYRMAIAAPALVGGVVAVDGVPFYPALMDTLATAERVRPQAAALRAAFAGLSPVQVAAQVRPGLARQVRDTAHHARVLRWAQTSDPATVGQAMAEVLTTDLRPQLGAIRAPVLQIAAVGAFPTPALRATALQRYAAQLVPLRSHALVAAAQAHHFVMLDDPAFFHATLDRFLARVAVPTPDGDVRGGR